MRLRKKFMYHFGGAFIAVIALLAFRLGHHLTYSIGTRNPTSIERSYDFSHLKNDELKKAVRNRIVEGISLVGSHLSLGYELGAFYSKNKVGQTSGVCEQYQNIELIFTASGMAVSGEPPSLRVNGTCHSSDYQNKIVAMIIPFQKILDEKPRDLQMNLNLANIVSLKLLNVSDSWPTTWVLSTIRLTGEDVDPIEISQDEIKNISGKFIAIELP